MEPDMFCDWGIISFCSRVVFTSVPPPQCQAFVPLYSELRIEFLSDTRAFARAGEYFCACWPCHACVVVNTKRECE